MMARTQTNNLDFKGRKVCMVAPFPPRKGGVTVQTELLVKCLKNEQVKLLPVDTNLQKLRIPAVGTPVRLAVQPWVILLRLLMVITRCEVVHIQAAANWGFLPAIIAVPVCWLFNRRCVLCFHSGIGPKFMDRFPWIVKTMFRLATVSVVVSPELQEAFKERGINSEFLRNLFDCETFKFRDRKTIKPRIAWTRYLMDIYDPFVALDAFEIVKSKYPEATLTMTGEGNLESAIRERIAERGLTGVTLTGRLPLSGVAKVLDEADIFLNTSKHDGLPTTLLEAAAAGIPIVTTGAGGISSLLKNGEEAILSPVGDAQALADAMLGLISNPHKARNMAQAAYSVAKQFVWSSIKPELLNLYGFTSKPATARIPVFATLRRAVTSALTGLGALLP